MTDTTNRQAAPTVKTRIVLWPTLEGDDFDSGDLSLTEAGAIELGEFARDYAGVPLLELMRRLRVAEWNAAEYQRQAEQLQETVRRTPPLHVIEEVDARHKRIKALLAKPGPISKALLTAALAEPDDAWNARTSTTDQGAAA
jgi:hypothetical protein